MKQVTFKDIVKMFDQLKKTHSIQEIMDMPIQVKESGLVVICKERENVGRGL